MSKYRFSTLSAIAVVVFSVAATGPCFAQKKGPVDEPALFYPQPPSPPRLQFMKVYASSLDLATEKKGFRDFVFGGTENERRMVEKPYGLAVHDGAIYVVDTRGSGFVVFDLKTGKSRVVQPTGAGALKKPINIAIDVDGTRYVTDTGREQVLVYGADDRLLRALGKPGQFTPIDVAIRNDRLYLTDGEHQEVVVLDKSSGEELLRFGGAGNKPGQLLHPASIAFGPDDTIFVVDSSNFRVQEFDLDGKLVRTMGSVGSNPGQFTRPKGIDVDKDGNIYVVDAAFSNVQILDPVDGGAKMAFGGVGGPDSIELPSVVKISYELVPYFSDLAAPGFDLEYIVLVTSQFGPNKVVVFGFGDLVN